MFCTFYRAVHQTITVRDVLDPRAILLHGRPCAEDSWFPGYAWTIASCARCLNHLGWRFTLVPPTIGTGLNSSAMNVIGRTLAGTTVADLWRNLLQEQSSAGEEEESEGSEGSESQVSGSDMYSDNDYYDVEEEEAEEEMEEVLEGESEAGNDESNEDSRLNSGSEHSSTHSFDMQNESPVNDAVVDSVNSDDNSRSSSSRSRRSSSNDESEQSSRGEHSNHGNSINDSNLPLSTSANDRVVSFW